MTITATQLKEIRQEFTRLKPAAVTLDGNRVMSVKEAIFALAPTLERMKKRGFDSQEIVERLHEKGIEVKPQTDARRDNSPGSGAISSSKSLLHICQQNYKKAKGEGNPSPFLFTVYSVSFSRSASTAVSLPRLIS